MFIFTRSKNKVPQTRNIEQYLDELNSAILAEVTFGKELEAEIEHQRQTSSLRYRPNKTTRERHYRRQRADINFQAYDASLIPGTNFIAASGPIDTKDLAIMCKEIFLNKKFENLQVIALVNETSRLPQISEFGEHAQSVKDDADCLDYFSESGKFSYKSDISQTESITISAKIKDEKTVKFKNKGIKRQNGYTNRAPKQSYDSRIVITRDKTEKDTVSKATVDVHCLPMTDNTGLQFLQNGDQAGVSKIDIAKLYQLYESTLTRPTLVHCAAGCGRTGHFILTCILLANFHQIFFNDIQTTKQNVINWINHIRSFRHGALLTPEQVSMAIRNTFALYQYQQQLIKEGHEIPKMELKTPFPKFCSQKNQEYIVSPKFHGGPTIFAAVTVDSAARPKPKHGLHMNKNKHMNVNGVRNGNVSKKGANAESLRQQQTPTETTNAIETTDNKNMPTPSLFNCNLF